MFKLLFRNVFNYYAKGPLLQTQVFHRLSNKQLATPQMMKSLIRKRIAFHSRMSQTCLFHKKRVRHAIKSCFSQKKTKRFKRVHKVVQYFHSKILDKNLRLRLSMKAYRCVLKMGSIDQYILCTKPKDLDSKFGEYLRSIFLRKINDPEYRIPYIIGTNRVERIKKHQRYYFNKKNSIFVVPKQFKKNLQTLQKRFGSSVDELNNEDYKKYLELERLKKTTGNEIEPTHPLLLELNKKLHKTLTDEQEAKIAEMSEQFKNDYINHPKNTQYRRMKYEKNEKQAQIMQLKLKQAFIKFQSTVETQ